MREMTLGKSGLRVSAVGFGGIPIQRISENEAATVIRTAIDLGVTFFDTAAGYTDSESKIGKAIAGRRDGLVLATKSGSGTREGAQAEIERSLRQMKTDVIDLFQFHGISDMAKWEQITGPGGAMEAVLEAQRKGDVAHVGFTSHSLDTALELVEEEIFETVQFPFNLVTSEPADELIPKARERALGFIAMKPLCGGQYDDAVLAFKFLNGFSDVVPIPGIEKVEEIEQIVAVVASGAVLEGAEKERAEKIAADLGKLFCRRCDYCEPCPHGVPIQTAMNLHGLCKRLPPASIAGWVAGKLSEEGTKCTECGECEEKCPYDLPIIETVKASVEKAKAIMADWEARS
ncbi:MAG: aldo/keto reductase [Planctomycetes bacterium]|nr:aldo/keto reductase [Planctomycetota bacterium]